MNKERFSIILLQKYPWAILSARDFKYQELMMFNVNAWMDLDCKFYDFCFVVAIHVASLNSHTKVHAIYKPFRLDARLICY